MFHGSIYIFVCFFWPYAVILLMVYGLCVLFRYIVHKMRDNVDSIPFTSKAKKMFKWFLFIYLVPAVFTLLFLFIYPQKTQDFMWDLYWKISDLQKTIEIEGWVLMVGSSFLMSLVFLAYYLQHHDTELSIKALLYYLLVSIPILCGFLYLSCHVNLFVLIIILGLPGALISFLKG